MWDRLKQVFARRAAPESAPSSGPISTRPAEPSSAAPSPMRWIPASESEFHVEVLDIRPVALGMISTSRDPQCAANAIGWQRDDGRSFIGTEPTSAVRVGCQLSYAAPAFPIDGRWFCPEVMEEKWALYHYDNRIYALRSWTRELSFVAHTRRQGGEIAITAVDVVTRDGQRLMDDELTQRHVDFVVKSHVLGADVPAPLPAEMERDPRAIAMYCFSLYGRRATSATFADLHAHRIDRQIRADSPLILAIESRDAARAMARIAEAPPEELEAPGRHFGHAPLHAAAILGARDVIEELLRRGADVNRRSDLGRTALHDAASFVSAAPETLRLLLAAGADVRARDRDGAEPLHLAAQSGDVETVKLLLGAGGSRNALTHRGLTPLRVAEKYGHTAVAGLLAT